MKKKILIFFNIVFIICFLIKLYHFIILINIHKNLNDFKSEINRKYSVETKINENRIYNQKIFFKNDVIKYNLLCNNKILYCEYKDVKILKKYTINSVNKEVLSDNCIMLEKVETLYDLPNLFEKNNILKHLFPIYYIIPTKYNDTKAFKIVTASEEIIIDANTFLPVHLIKKNYNSNNNLENCIEYNYEFEIGTVTDEDVALPNLSEYKLID